VSESILEMSGVQLSRAIRSGQVSSGEVVDAHIARAQAINPRINAIVKDRFDLARAESRRADTLFAHTPGDQLPPLHGVPFTVKESFALRGMPQSSGLWSRRDYVADRDAPVVSRLREAGAIPLGVTNVSELCMWMESSNRVYGRTRNPYDPSRIVGGSSGGEGAIIGAGASPFGLGADIGGSIRMPAFFNGVFGHKPSSGLIPNTGQYPIAENDALLYLSTGPLARRADDLWPLVKLMAGPDGEDPTTEVRELGDPATVSLVDLEVLTARGNGFRRVAPDLRSAQHAVEQALTDRGARVRRVRFEGLEKSLDIWAQAMAEASGTAFKEHLGLTRRRDLGFEFIRWALRRSRHTLPALMLAVLESVPALVPEDTSEMMGLAAELRQDLESQIGDGVLLYPSYTRPAPRHRAPLFTPVDWVFTALLNVMQLPSTQVPLGLSADGVPLGIQVASRHGNDHVTVAVAMELEAAFGGWVPPWRD
jgi:fatty acid amide hydrolase 2